MKFNILPTYEISTERSQAETARFYEAIILFSLYLSSLKITHGDMICSIQSYFYMEMTRDRANQLC